MVRDAKNKRASATGDTSPGASRQRPAAATGHENGAPQRPGPERLMLDIDFVRELIAAVDDSDIDTVEINRAGTHILISKTPTRAAIPAVAAQQLPVAGAGAAPVAAPPSEPEPSAEPEPNLFDVQSPMVGTFYRAPAPEAPPYVEVGSHVTKGQTLCILEAMKLMNELESDVDGTVREILAENADPVEYGQTLFRIEPAGS